MIVAPESMVDVLIVDDQAPFRSVARALVGRLTGWRVVAEAVSGEEALTAAATVRPGIVLMDINLPGIDGIEATRRILERRPDTTVILLSTYARDDLPPEAMTCGAPVAASGTSAIPELLGDPAATFDPADPADIARCVREVLDSPARLEALRGSSREQVAVHTWERVARRTIEGYGRALDFAPDPVELPSL